ncbi:MAG: WD40 repeat domain-containing protein [Anaerolineae bacterium]|nr:WD40 repeat domain-containing protein [Anaerolineae bacterium]
MALMLARDAVSISLEAGELPTVNAQNTLQQVVDHVSPWIATLPRDRHEGAIFGVDFSPDGHTIATAGADETIRLWDIATGRQLQILQGHEYGVWAIRFSPDGRRLVSASLDGTARVWDLQTGQMRARLPHGDIVWWASFNPDGRTIVTACDDGLVRIWNPTSGKLLRELRGHGARVMTANFSPDGAQIVTASGDGTAKLWRTIDGKRFKPSAVIAWEYFS